MKSVRETVVEAIVVLIVGVGVALAANAMRGTGGLALTKNYFDKGSALAKRKPSVAANEQRTTAAKKKADPSSSDDATAKHLDHGFQEVTLAQVVDIFNDPNTTAGANIFVDARRDEQYEEGHIPGAIQADHYRLADYIDNVLAQAEGAEKIIVYCNGGDCEDSIFMCNDLLDFDVPYDSIYLFAGGWKEWTAGGMPVATGREGE